MATFCVYQDDQENARHVGINQAKLKVSKVDLIPRSVFAEINSNKVIDQKPHGLKPLDTKQLKLQQKDVSKVLKDVQLNTKDNKNESEVRVPLSIKHEISFDDSGSDISLDISACEIDEKYSYAHRIKLHTEVLYDCLQYRDDIYAYLRELEVSRKPKPFYMKKQPDITYTMRSVLVDWLVEVAEEYKLQGETLFMAVSYIDRFLSMMAVVRSKLQLLGTAAMLVAAKYEEIYPPEVSEFIYITDDTYTEKQLLKMEQLILKTLNFDISVPNHHTFITHLTKVADIESIVSTLALYICELTLTEADPYLQYPPSLIACGALALARHRLGHVDVWPEKLAQISGYSLQRHLAQVLPHLNETHCKAPTLSLAATRDKYKGTKNFGVSLISHKPLIVRDPTTL